MPHHLAKANSQPRWLFPFVVTFVACLCVLPLARLVAAGISSILSGRALSLLADPAVWSAAVNTLSTSFFGMIAALVIGGLYALALTLADVRGKWLLSFLFMLPTMIPPQVQALAWVGMSGPSSPLLKALGIAPPLGSAQPLYSIGGIALLHGVQHAPLVYLSLRAGLLALQQQYPVIGDVRGLGLMIGTEFRGPDRKPDKPTAKALARACHQRGLMLLTCGPWDNVIRWIPPLVVTEAQVDKALEIFADSLREVVG